MKMYITTYIPINLFIFIYVCTHARAEKDNVVLTALVLIENNLANLIIILMK